MQWRNDAGLADRVVVVTGAAGGIGRAVCQALDEAKARVFAVDVSQEAVEGILAELKNDCHAGRCLDLGNVAAHPGLLREAQAHGQLAAVIHVAALLVRQPTVDEVTEEDWDLQHETNLKATFFLNRAAQRAFVAEGTEGAIVNFTSQGWWTGGYGGSVVYAASKGGVVSLTRGLARTYAGSGVRVNAVAPGGIDTSMMWSGMTEQSMAEFTSMIPMGRLGRPEELAGAVLYLASSASRYVTGAVINVSGGQLMY